MNIQVKKCGLIDNAPRKFIVSNHMSYLDVLILSSQFPTTFVTSMEIKETPGLGLITKLGGCLYVERRNKSNLLNEIKEVTEALRQNIPVTVFPEATSTNGESVLRFKKPLFQAAVESQSAISPICINYLKIDGKPFQFSNRDYLCWYGDMDFIPHLWNLMALKEVIVELRLFKNISPAETPEPLFLAERAHNLIREKFVPAAGQDHAKLS